MDYANGGESRKYNGNDELLTGAMRQKQFMIHMVGFQIQVLG
jgi:hypothetical protein